MISVLRLVTKDMGWRKYVVRVNLILFVKSEHGSLRTAQTKPDTSSLSAVIISGHTVFSYAAELKPP